MKRTSLLLASVAVLTALPQTSMAQQRGSGDRIPGDVELEKMPVAANDYEKKVLTILDDISENQRYRNVPKHDGRLLRILTRTMDAKNVIEIGTSTGYSAIWIGLALKETGGKMITYELDKDRAAAARANFKRVDMHDVITLIEGDAHEEIKKLKEPIDMIFLDADKEGYVDYLKKLLPLVRKGGLVIAHNINPRMADPNYMKAVTSDPNLETVVRGAMGITLKKK